ncbi:MAG TPA: cytochrome c peroxidase [Verrucomicrobiae bacterium]|nr:cytochrome c peroxidase [Verrucomicrobiae bacterium]
MLQRKFMRRVLPLCIAGAFLVSAAATAVAITSVDPETMKAEFRRPDSVPFPEDRPYDAAMARLGEHLFMDPLLSGNNQSSCATCHQPGNNWQDGVPKAMGLDGMPLPRRTPTLWNMAWGNLYFWDGRAKTLEEQVLGPMQNPREMGQQMEQLVSELSASTEYQQLFAAAFPESPTVDEKTISRALATYVRTIVSAEAPFDRWIAGDESAISDSAKRGYTVFAGKGNCAACHSGWNFTDNSFQDIGLPGEDRGRGEVLKLAKLDFAFKTPTLRNVAERGPYMHDGSVATLEAVIDHYNGRFLKRPTLARDMRDIGLTDAEKADLVEFLKALTSDGPAIQMGALPGTEVTGATAGLRRISQRGLRFDPEHVSLNAGEQIVFVNDDNRYHNVIVSGPSMNYDSGTMEPGTESALQFPEAGIFEATCLIHPQMTLEIEVKQ